MIEIVCCLVVNMMSALLLSHGESLLRRSESSSFFTASLQVGVVFASSRRVSSSQGGVVFVVSRRVFLGTVSSYFVNPTLHFEPKFDILKINRSIDQVALQNVKLVVLLRNDEYNDILAAVRYEVAS